MIEKFEKFAAVVKGLPADMWAVFMLLVGGVLAITKHPDEAKLVIGGALAAFKGNPPNQA